MGLYDSIRILQHKEALDAIEAGQALECGPIHVRIEPTESCNFKCSFCYWHADDRRATLPMFDFNGKRRMDLPRLLLLIDEIADLGTRAVSFTGAGDPLVFPGMEQVLARIRGRGMRLGMTSNLAMQVSDALIEELAHASWVRWSMNAGTLETYIAVNNPKGPDGAAVFERAQENVRRLDRARRRRETPPDFNASFVVYKSNQHDVYEGARLAHSLGVDSVSFRPDTPFERQTEPNVYAAFVADLIRRAQADFQEPRFQVHMNLDRAEDIQKLGDPDLVCFYSNHETYIAASGDVYPCCYTRHDRRFVLGNIMNQSFSSFWTSDARRAEYRRLVYDTCPPCPYGPTNQALKLLYRGERKAADLYSHAEERDYFV